MEPVIEEIEAIKLVGLKAPFRGTTDENPNNFEVIPKLWQELMSRLDEIQNKIEGDAYGVIDCREFETKGAIYCAMTAVRNFDNVPEGMETFTFPKCRLAKFRHQGNLAGLGKTIQYILGTWVPQSKHKVSDKLELEIYPAGYNPEDPDSYMEYSLMLE